MTDSSFEQKRCDVCSRVCDEIPTVKHNQAWRCRSCNVKYFNRDPEKYKPHVYVTAETIDLF